MCSGFCFASTIVAVISIGLAIGMLMTAVPVFNEFYGLYQSTEFKVMTQVGKIFPIFGSKIEIPGVELIPILTWTSGITIGASVLQLVNSLFLLVGSWCQTDCPAVCFGALSVMECVAYGGCWLASVKYFNMFESGWSDLTPNEIQYWQLVMVANAVFLLYASFQTVCFLCTTKKSAPVLVRRRDGMTYMTAKTV